MTTPATLEIKDLHVNVDEKEILKGINLTVKEGEIHALMGPNGSGKSTLAYTILGHPNYEVTKGQILFNGEDITEMSTDKRAQLGLFLAFQYPQTIDGVSLVNFLRTAASVRNEGKPVNVLKFMDQLKTLFEQFNLSKEFVTRYVNEGFSGGERKKNEVIQMTVLKPKVAILDEPDSGLDVDALKEVSEGLNRLHEETNVGLLIITHYQRILNFITPDYVHILIDGKIVKSGDKELALLIEKEGYEVIKEAM